MMKKKLALGTLMACLIVGNVGFANSIGTVTVDGEEISVTPAGEFSIGSENSNNVSIINSSGHGISLIDSVNDKGTISGKDIVIVSESNRGIYLNNGTNLTVGNDKTEKISVSANDIAIVSLNKSQLELQTKELVVNAVGDNAMGIHVQSGTQTAEAPDASASIKIDAENIVVNSVYSGLSAYSNGQMNINGNLVVNAQNAINVRGNSTVNINTDGKHTTVLNGDIIFQTPATPENAHGSGQIINAYVNVNLSGDDSSWTGKAYQMYKDSENDAEYTNNVELDEAPYQGNVTGFEMNISNGAQWNMTGDSFINNVDLNDGGVINVQEDVEKFNAAGIETDGGVINLQGTAAEVNIYEMNGNATVNMQATTDNGEEFTTSKINIGKDNAESNAKIDVNFKGITADDVKNGNEALNNLAENIQVNGSDTQLTGSLNIAEGILSGAVSGDVNTESGNIDIDNVTQNTASSTMENMRDVASVALVAWRQEDSTLSQRLGELRKSEGDQGIWTRMSRGEFEYGGAFKNQYNYFQIGYDKAYGDWHYGAAVSHNDGKTTYAAGNGENRSTSLSLYGTWLGEKGNYVDVVLKQGRLSNEFTNYADAGKTTGDYDAWGTSLSAEYGQKVAMQNDWYVTPQAQLTYMRIGGEDYTANANGKAMQVSQDTLQSFVGRVGFELGKNVSDKGSVYVKASLLHEFAGDADTYLRMGDLSNSYKQDLSDTWYECGLGVNYKTSANSYVYADVVKTFGGDVETPWQWNAGMRWSF